MANELTFQFQTNLSNGELKDQHSSNSISVDQTTAKLVRNVQTVGTAAAGEALDMGDLASAGYAIFVNLDDTNFVEIGRSIGGSFEEFLKVEPGEQALCRLATATPYAKADTSDVELFYIIYDD